MNRLKESLDFIQKAVKYSTEVDKPFIRDDPNMSTEDILNNVSFTENDYSLDNYLLRVKEIKDFYKKTGIKPRYLFYVVVSISTIIVVNFFPKFFTLLIGIIYPVRASIKSIKTKTNIQKWLKYWVVFALFLDIETIFGKFFANFEMYLFYKVVFLFLCFLPWYNFSDYIYTCYLRECFIMYQDYVISLSSKISSKIMEKLYVEENTLDNEESEGEEEEEY